MQWLKELRIQKGLTQEAVAKGSQMTRTAYGNIEVGKRQPSVRAAKRISTVLGFDWTRFFEENRDSA